MILDEKNEKQCLTFPNEKYRGSNSRALGTGRPHRLEA
jgi:hypothetical protein